MVPYPEKLAEKRMLVSDTGSERIDLFPLECIFAWKHHSFNHIAAVLLFNVIPAVVYYLVVYAYYKQAIDPGHNASLLGARLTAGAMTAGRHRDEHGYSRIEVCHRTHNRADEAGMTTARLEYAPMVGVPRQRGVAQQAPYAKSPTDVNAASGSSSGPKSKRSFVSRGINRSHRPPPLISSPSPLGLNSTPGAPTYNRGPSRVYAAFVAPVSSSEYDKFV